MEALAPDDDLKASADLRQLHGRVSRDHMAQVAMGPSLSLDDSCQEDCQLILAADVFVHQSFPGMCTKTIVRRLSFGTWQDDARQAVLDLVLW